MSEPLATPRRGSSLDWWRNPVAVKELRGRMRGRRAFVMLTAYAGFMSALIALLYLGIVAGSGPSGPDQRTTGKTIFGAVLFLQVGIVLFITPAFTAGALAGEREHQTYDILRTTLLTARELVGGKLLSALAFVGLLNGVAIPLQGIAFLLGGLAPVELILSQLMLAAAAVAYALLGLYFSSAMRSTLSASVTTLGLVLLGTFGAPLGALMLVSFVGPFVFALGSGSPWLEAGLIYTGIFLAATNLPASLIVSDVLLIQEGAVWLARLSLSSGPAVPVPSPWILMIAWHALIALVLYWLTIRRVRRIADA